MDDRSAITQQYSFAVGEDGETDGIEPTEESVETSLETFGADVDHRERDSRIDQPEATTFGVDDRASLSCGDGGEQRALFADTEDDQQTLTGERAASQCLFETDDDPADTTSAESTDEPTDAGGESDETPIRAVADGGRVEDDENDCEDADTSETVMVAIPRKDLAGVADALDAERQTIKRYAGEGPKTEELTRLVEESRIGLSLLAINDETGTISRVAAAAAADELQEAVKTETGDYAEELQRLSGVLRHALHGQSPSDEDAETNHESDGEPMTDGGRTVDDPTETEETTFDPDAETVADTWEGAYIYTSWGYGQTNVELAQITDVSESGKTILARRVKAECVEHGRGTDQLRPTPEQYGDEFRLHVRNSGGDPAFRGSYPYINGKMDEGTRRDSFLPFNNKVGNSIHQTPPNHRH